MGEADNGKNVADLFAYLHSIIEFNSIQSIHKMYNYVYIILCILFIYSLSIIKKEVEDDEEDGQINMKLYLRNAK